MSIKINAQTGYLKAARLLKILYKKIVNIAMLRLRQSW